MEAPAAAAQDVTRRLTQGTRFAEAVSAVQDALAYAGVATHDSEVTYVEATAPVAGTRVALAETFNLALEAHDRESAAAMTAVELGQMLADFGWPFRSGANPGEEMVAFFAAWVTAARANPDDPESFAPMFIAEMVGQQQPLLDLAAGSAAPEQLRFSMLELLIFAAAFDRELTGAIQVGATPSIVLAGDVKTACAFLQNETSILTLISDAWRGIGAEVPGGEILRQLEDWAITEGFSTGLESALKRIGVGEGSIDDLGKALDATATVMRIWKLVVLYRNVKVFVNPATDSIHKPIAEDGGEQVVSFRATVGIPPEDLEDYKQQYGELGADFVSQAHECLDMLGLPAPATLGTITEGIDGWILEWTPLEGRDHIDIRLARNTFDFAPYRKILHSTDDYTAETELLVDIQQEPRKNHRDGSTIEGVQVAIRAEADTAEPPSLSTFIDGAKGGLGLADAIVELAAGWIQSLKGPSAVGVVEVNYHALDACPDATGLPQIILAGDVVAPDEAAVCRADLSGQLTITRTGWYLIRDDPGFWRTEEEVTVTLNVAMLSDPGDPSSLIDAGSTFTVNGTSREVREYPDCTDTSTYTASGTHSFVEAATLDEAGGSLTGFVMPDLGIVALTAGVTYPEVGQRSGCGFEADSPRPVADSWSCGDMGFGLEGKIEQVSREGTVSVDFTCTNGPNSAYGDPERDQWTLTVSGTLRLSSTLAEP